jgi:hypothetical protein
MSGFTPPSPQAVRLMLQQQLKITVASTGKDPVDLDKVDVKVTGEEKVAQLIIDMLNKVAGDIQREVERQYGSCRRCYGKGYCVNVATVVDDDADFLADPATREVSRNDIRVCVCSRGQELTKFFTYKEDLHED